MLSFDNDDAEHAMRQAALTAEFYAREAAGVLHRLGGDDWPEQAQATFFAGFMQAAALDLHGAATLSAGQHIAQTLKDIAEERAA